MTVPGHNTMDPPATVLSKKKKKSRRYFYIKMTFVHRNINFLIISTGGELARVSLRLSSSKELNLKMLR